jgi:hypothetical protein
MKLQFEKLNYLFKNKSEKCGIFLKYLFFKYKSYKKISEANLACCSLRKKKREFGWEDRVSVLNL